MLFQNWQNIFSFDFFRLFSRRDRRKAHSLSGRVALMEQGFLSTSMVETLEPRTLLSVDPVLVADLVIGAGGSNPSNFVNVNGTLFFNANDGVNGIELWRSNGTAAGTKLVKDILTGSGGSYPGFLTNVNGTHSNDRGSRSGE
jgi:ELWxxDGT repeat protein